MDGNVIRNARLEQSPGSQQPQRIEVTSSDTIVVEHTTGKIHPTVCIASMDANGVVLTNINLDYSMPSGSRIEIQPGSYRGYLSVAIS
jgi:hypothetical protein